MIRTGKPPGMAALQTRCRAMRDAVRSGELLAAAAEKAYAPMAREAQALAPDRELADGIEVAVVRTSSGVRVGLVVRGRAHYRWHWSEFGYFQMRAHPYLRPAYLRTKQEALRVLGREVSAGLVQIAKRG